MNETNKIVTSKMITGAESGGQVYGAGKWNYVKPAQYGKEVTITLGAYQFYGNEGQELMTMIEKSDPDMIGPVMHSYIHGFNWVDSKWNPSKSVRDLIAMIISSEIGIEKQVELFCDIQLPTYIRNAEEFGVVDDKAQMMWVEIEHVGGLSAAERVFKRCNGDFSLDNIMLSLKQDQYDTSSDNQAGDSRYWSRHIFCRACIDKYAVENDDFDGVYVEV